jgi:hypothetical protein
MRKYLKIITGSDYSPFMFLNQVHNPGCIHHKHGGFSQQFQNKGDINQKLPGPGRPGNFLLFLRKNISVG